MKPALISCLTAIHLHSRTAHTSGPERIDLIRKIIHFSFWTVAAVFPLSVIAGPQDVHIGRFWDYYFEHSLPGFVLVTILWLIKNLMVTGKTTAERIYLMSLPLSDASYFDLRVMLSLKEMIWIPAVTAALYFISLPAGSVFFCIQLSVLTAVIFLASLCFRELIAAVAGKKPGKNRITADSRYLSSIAMAGLFILLHIAILILSEAFTPGIFILLGGSFAAVGILCKKIFCRIFDSTRQALSPGKSAAGASGQKPLIFSIGWNVPMAGKNLLLLVRRQLTGTLGAVSFLFLVLSLLAASNNPEPSVRMSLLLTLTVLFFLGLSFHIQSLLSNKTESTQIIFSLPFTKWTLYSGLAIPAFIWISGMCITLFWMALLSNMQPAQAALLTVKGLITGFAFVNSSAIYTVTHFPHDTVSVKKYASSIGILGFFLLFLYPYWFQLICLWSLLNFTKLLKKTELFINGNRI